MTIYLLWVGLVIFLAPVAFHRIKFMDLTVDGKALYAGITFLTLFAIMALRDYTVGIDTVNYATNMFPYAASRSSVEDVLDDWNLSKAPVYWVVLYFASYISDDPQMYIFCVSFAIVSGLLWFLYRASDNLPLSIFLFWGLSLMSFSMSGARQYCSVVLALNAFLFLYKDVKSIKGWGLFIASIFVHVTSIIFILPIIGILLSKRIKNIWRLCLFILLGCLCVVGGIKAITEIFLQWFPQYDIYFDPRFAYNILTGYTNSPTRPSMTNLSLIVCLFLYLFAVWHKKIRYSETITYAIFPGALLYGIIGFLTYESVDWWRILLSLESLYMVFIPNMIMLFRPYTRKILYFVIYTGVTITVIFKLQAGGFDWGTIPYQFFF